MRERRARANRVKATEAVKSLDARPRRTPRRKRTGSVRKAAAAGEALPGPAVCETRRRKRRARLTGPRREVGGEPGGRPRRPHRRLSRTDTQAAGKGKGRRFVAAPFECREGLASALASRRTRRGSKPRSGRSCRGGGGRPHATVPCARATRPTAGTFRSVRGCRRARAGARPASTAPPAPMWKRAEPSGCSQSCRRTLRGERRRPLPARRARMPKARRLRAASALPFPQRASASRGRRRRSSSSRSLRPTFRPALSACGRSGRRTGALQALIEEAWRRRGVGGADGRRFALFRRFLTNGRCRRSRNGPATASSSRLLARGCSARESWQAAWQAARTPALPKEGSSLRCCAASICSGSSGHGGRGPAGGWRACADDLVATRARSPARPKAPSRPRRRRWPGWAFAPKASEGPDPAPQGGRRGLRLPRFPAALGAGPARRGAVTRSALLAGPRRRLCGGYATGCVSLRAGAARRRRSR